MTDLQKRPIGRTELEVTALGLGCATLGGSRVPVGGKDAEAIVPAAWMAGVRYVDTAPFYGFGQAERCVGNAMREVPRDEWVLSIKVGRLLRPRQNIGCKPNVQMSVPSNLKMSVSPAFWRALGGDSSGGAERERCRTEAS
jgi:D-threo-aldose 1-dehydrogenase